jgi:putative hemolysin
MGGEHYKPFSALPRHSKRIITGSRFDQFGATAGITRQRTAKVKKTNYIFIMMIGLLYLALYSSESQGGDPGPTNIIAANSVLTVDEDKCFLYERAPGLQVDIPLVTLILEEIEIKGDSVAIRAADYFIVGFDTFDGSGPDEYQMRSYRFKLSSVSSALEFGTQLIEAAKRCGAADHCADQQPLTSFERRTLFTSDTTFEFMVVTVNKLYLSADCLTPSKKLKCQAYDALKVVSTINMDTSGGRNPGAVLCAGVGGWLRVFTDEEQNQTSFCGFADGSKVSSGSLYDAAIRNDLAL